MRPGRVLLLGLFATAMLLMLAACDSATPGGGPVPPATETAAALASQYDVPATFTAITLAASAWQTPATGEDMRQPPDLDACLYLTAEDVKAAMGRSLEQNTRGTGDSLASCTYSGDANYVTLSVYQVESEAQAAQLAGELLDYIQERPAEGEFLPGLGDAATLVRLFPPRNSPDQVPKPEEQTGWNMTLNHGLYRLYLKWYTDSFDEKEKLVDLMTKVLSHFK
jgi:hypothetical protein